MAKATKAKVETPSGPTPAQQAKSESIVANIPEDVPEADSIDDLDDLLGTPDAKPVPSLKPPKIPRQLKGEMVTFKTSKDKTVVGMGTIYYVARMNGKLYYKEASQVHIMTPEEIKTYEDEQATKKTD